jgi:hypothetical protein
MSNTPGPLSPIKEAEQTLQVAGVLTRMEQRFRGGDWAYGAHTGRDGGNCLIGAIDEATRWTMVGTKVAVTDALVAQLPQPYRMLARLRPRFALALYNDTVGRRDGAMSLVTRARDELGCLSPAPEGPAVIDLVREEARAEAPRLFTAKG